MSEKPEFPPTSLPPGAREGLLKGPDEAAYEAVFAAGRRLPLARGEVLFRQDDPAASVFMLQSGRVRLVQHTEEGRQVILRVMGPGKVIGIVAAMGGCDAPG